MQTSEEDLRKLYGSDKEETSSYKQVCDTKEKLERIQEYLIEKPEEKSKKVQEYLVEKQKEAEKVKKFCYYSPLTIDTIIEEADLSLRSYNQIKRAGIHTIKELFGKTEEEWSQINGLGKESIEELKGKKKEFLTQPSVLKSLKDKRMEIYLSQEQKETIVEHGSKKLSEVELDPLTIDTIIEEADLSLRSYNQLKRAGIHTIGEFLDKSEEELSQIKGLGVRSIEEIKQKKEEMLKQPSILESLKARKMELIEKSKAMEQQIREAEALLGSYEKLSGAKDNTEPDFKDE